MANTLAKVARVKLFLERRGHTFPTEYNLGECNDETSPYKTRILLRWAEKHFKSGNMEKSYETLKKAVLVIAMEPILDPLIKTDLMTEATCGVIKIAFARNMRIWADSCRSTEVFPTISYKLIGILKASILTQLFSTTLRAHPSSQWSKSPLSRR